MYVCLSAHAILAVRAIKSITKDTIVLSVRFVAILKWRFSLNCLIELVDSISRDERGFPLTQYITNGRIFSARYTITHFKHHHRVLRLISYRMNV